MSNCKCKVEAKPCAIPLVVPPERAQVLYLEEAEAARTAAQNAANVATQSIAGYEQAKVVLDNIDNYRQQAEVSANNSAISANEAEASATLAGQKADSASESASYANTASATAIQTLRDTQLIANSGNADQLSTTNAADITLLSGCNDSLVNVLQGVELSVNATVAERYIKENGSAAYSSSGAVIKKYSVVEDDILFLDLQAAIRVTYQFQTDNIVPTSTNPYIVGALHSGQIKSYVTVPKGATWLIVSQEPNTTNHVYSVTNLASDKTLSVDGMFADANAAGTALSKKISALYASKNICNPNNKCNFYIPNGSGVYLSGTSIPVSYYVEVKPNTTYTITKANGTSRFGIGITTNLEAGASAIMLNYSTSSTKLTSTVTTPSDIIYKYLIIQVTTSDAPAFPQWVQVEEGYESTLYEEYSPYKDGETYCLKVNNSFEKVYTKDEIDKLLKDKSIFDKDANFGNISGLGNYYNCFLKTTNYNKNTMSDEVYNDFDRLVLNNSNYITRTDLGASSDGQHLYSYHFIPKYINNPLRKIPKILIIAGQHGFEKGSVFALYHLLYDVCNNWNSNSILDYLRHQVEFIVVPIVNRYGFDINEYKNANGVNLNRNYDTPAWKLVEDESADDYGGQAPFDQLETQIVRDLVLENTDATYFVDWHTNGAYSVAKYEYLNWITATNFDNDNYLSKVVNCAGYHIANITAHAVHDYNLIDIGDELCGYVTVKAAARPTAGAYAKDKAILAHTFETNNGIKGQPPLNLNCQKLGAEIFGNWLASLLYELSK